MRDQILAELRRTEELEGCRVLYACESGSRAWGFASPDSDYDLRFIYAKPVDWHLRLEKKQDTIDRMAPNDLDLTGWELAKTLRLFAGCNLALNEWFDSPEVYHAEAEFVAEVRNLVPRFFNPRKAAFHYFSMAANTLNQHLHGSQIGIKKIFYVLRPLLACTWVFSNQTMPPTRFQELLEDATLPSDLVVNIRELLLQKETAMEQEKITLSPTIADWIDQALLTVKGQAPSLPVADTPDWDALNSVMLKWTAWQDHEKASS